ncbi:MAG: pantoate--beta-alanine ligase [Bacteroidales bacterium]|jgi:pantoate--beta-alanine ligase|nr:pantoate--beta-alanine ligase [Bacteroidales bacterium]MDD3161324.1 pantoate--beta-alanine ligase [Bacteroidales bacterium]
MKKITTIPELKKVLQESREKGFSVGLVPTMGALHSGHISLVNKSVTENDVTVVSVFVNPTQFNDKNDLERYPRTLEADMALLEQAGCTIVFAPGVEEMYPEPDTRTFSFAPLDQVMEGPARPGHFNGVAQIVSKLFFAVEPDRAYFGQKDFQQVAIIRLMTKQLNLPIEIVSCPIMREESGLALSSRNMLLSDEERKKATKISQALFKSTTFVPAKSVEEIKAFVTESLSSDPIFRMEYFEIVDGDTLQSVKSWDDASYVVGCITIYCGKIRLIDNVVYKK